MQKDENIHRRNVGLHDDVDRDFFEQILKERSVLLEDHVTSYLGVVCSNPKLAGLRTVDQSIGVTCCFFMVRRIKLC